MVLDLLVEKDHIFSLSGAAVRGSNLKATASPEVSGCEYAYLGFSVQKFSGQAYVWMLAVIPARKALKLPVFVHTIVH